MISGWSVSFYRVMMQAYPAEFRHEFGESVDQAFRDSLRDAFKKRGHLGVALLWVHVISDFLFSAGELLLSKAGDFLKWRFRLQWVVACSLGFVLSRLTVAVIGSEFFRGLDAVGRPWISVGTILRIAVLLSSVGLIQSRVLAGRCFRKTQWVLYGFAGAVLGTLILEPLWRVAAVPVQLRLAMWIREALGGGDLGLLADSVIGSVQMALFGACTGLLQSAAIRNDATTRYRWMTACAAGYFLSQAVGGMVGQVIPAYPNVIAAILTSCASGLVLGLMTSGPLERILFTHHVDEHTI